MQPDTEENDSNQNEQNDYNTDSGDYQVDINTDDSSYHASSDEQKTGDEPITGEMDVTTEHDTMPKKKHRKPITLEDVKNALIDENGSMMDVFKTNAKVIQERIGRGSVSTVQKRLKEIRDARKKLIEPLPEDMPSPPDKVIDMLWKAAYEKASNHYMFRMAELSANKDNLQLESDVLRSDMDVLMEEITSLESKLDSLEDDVSSTKAEMKSKEEAFASKIAEMQGQLSEARTQNGVLTKLIEDNLSK